MKKIYLDELEAKSEELTKYSKTDIAQKIEELKKLSDNFVWKGLGYTSYINGYNKKTSELERFNDGLTKLANFLLITKENYHDANEKIANAYEELLADFKRGDN